MKSLRCMAYPQDGVFVAACLDLALAAQGDSLQEAMDKLDLQVKDFIETVCDLPDQKQARELLFNRKAPASMWLKYWLIAIRMFFRQSGPAKLFTEPCKALA